jgi:hypothetical protein
VLHQYRQLLEGLVDLEYPEVLVLHQYRQLLEGLVDLEYPEAPDFLEVLAHLEVLVNKEIQVVDMEKNIPYKNLDMNPCKDTYNDTYSTYCV